MKKYIAVYVYIGLENLYFGFQSKSKWLNIKCDAFCFVFIYLLHEIVWEK